MIRADRLYFTVRREQTGGRLNLRFFGRHGWQGCYEGSFPLLVVSKAVTTDRIETSPIRVER
jgi:hypothetical protein